MAKTDSKAITKVGYKPSPQSGEEFIVIVNFPEVSCGWLCRDRATSVLIDGVVVQALAG